MNEIILALLALLIGAAIGGVMPWVAYRLGKRNGYADGIASSFSKSNGLDMFSTLIPLIMMAAMPKDGMFSDYSQSKKTAE